MPTMRLTPRDRLNPQSIHLHQHRRNVHSQCGEDGVIEAIMGIVNPPNRFSVEFGAWDGQHLSNTWHLLTNQGWQGVLIEGSARKFLELLDNCQPYPDIHPLNAFVGYTAEDNLDTLLAQTPCPEDPALLSIDIDGNDYHVWKACQHYRPHVVVIEINQTVPNDVIYIQDADPKVSHGSSLAAMVELGQSKGYELVAAFEVNAFFVRREHFAKFNIPDNSLDAIYDNSPYVTHLFQMMDGTLVNAGNQKLLWKNIEFQWDQLQILPPEKRGFSEQDSGIRMLHNGEVAIPLVEKTMASELTVIFLHGLLQSLEPLYRWAVPWVGKANLLFPLLRGHSPVNTQVETLTLEALISDLNLVLNHSPGQRFLLVGVSLGAVLAAAVADDPRVVGVVAVDPLSNIQPQGRVDQWLQANGHLPICQQVRHQLMGLDQAQPANFTPLFEGMKKPLTVLSTAPAQTPQAQLVELQKSAWSGPEQLTWCERALHSPQEQAAPLAELAQALLHKAGVALPTERA
ncbi:alpha/beta fold hydrolase [Magnetococcus sp. PR-3]|uniref:alpha/beta fold hydrolase n=1 Tax=Magnetococcus sp. PR-3 TaxID=3120355 RepID=UPI002FCE5059